MGAKALSTRQLSLEQPIQQQVGVWQERVGHSHTAPRKSFLKILGQKQAALGFSSGREDHGIPDTELMIRGQITRFQLVKVSLTTASNGLWFQGAGRS